MANLNIGGIAGTQLFQNPTMWASNQVKNVKKEVKKAGSMDFRGFLSPESVGNFCRMA